MEKLIELYKKMSDNSILYFNHKFDVSDAATIEINNRYSIFANFDSFETKHDEFAALVHEYRHYISGATHKSRKERNKMSVKCTVIIQKEENWYVATDLTSGVASQGKSIDESLANLKEALLLYYENNTLPENTPSVFVTTMEVAL